LDIHNLLRLVLAQLSSTDSIPQAVQTLFTECHNSYPPSILAVNELDSCLRSALQMLFTAAKDEQNFSRDTQGTADHSFRGQPRVYLLVDGLDEVPYNQRASFFDLLHGLTTLNLPYLSLLVSSRYQNDISEAMCRPTKWHSISIVKSDVQGDIRLYMSEAMRTHSRLSSQSPETKAAIMTRLVEKGNGM